VNLVNIISFGYEPKLRELAEMARSASVDAGNDELLKTEYNCKSRDSVGPFPDTQDETLPICVFLIESFQLT